MERDQHRAAWQRFIKAERRDLANRQEGHLRKLLGAPLPDESPQKLQRLVEEDRLRALEGLVELLGEGGEISYKHIDDLTPEDRSARIRAEGEQIEWLVERDRKRRRR